jgi:hypothetical protein
MKYAIDKINVFQTGWSAIVLNIGVLNCYLRNPFKVQARLAMGSSVSHCWRSFHRAIERILCRAVTKLAQAADAAQRGFYCL